MLKIFGHEQGHRLLLATLRPSVKIVNADFFYALVTGCLVDPDNIVV